MIRSRRPARLVVATMVAMSCASSTVVRTARAQGTPAAPPAPTAESTFREARVLMDARKYAEACPKFAASAKLEPAAGTLLNLADCYEKNGQTASAWLTYKEAAKAAVGRNRADWVQTAMQRTTALEPKVAYWTITVRGPVADTPSLRIERDGAVLASTAWNTAVATDPGPHVVVASAPGRRSLSVRVDIASGKPTTTEIAALPVVDEPITTVMEPPPVAPSQEQGRGRRIAGWVVAGIGVVGVGVGTATGIRALGLRSDAKGLCSDYPDHCSPDASGPNDDSRTFATVSTISLAAGVALVAAGVVLVLTAPHGTSSTSALRSPVTSPVSTPLGGQF